MSHSHTYCSLPPAEKLMGMEEARGELKEIREEQTPFVGMLKTGTTKTEFILIQKCSYFKQKGWESSHF